MEPAEKKGKNKTKNFHGVFGTQFVLKRVQEIGEFVDHSTKSRKRVHANTSTIQQQEDLTAMTKGGEEIKGQGNLRQ